MTDLDPLEAIEALPLPAQVAVVISVLRSTRNSQSRIERKLEWINRSIWTLIATIVAGLILYVLTAPRPTAPRSGTGTTTSSASSASPRSPVTSDVTSAP